MDHIVNDHIKIKASRKKVWKTLTDPNLTRKYFFGCRVESDWEKGSPIHFRRKFLWMKIDLAGRILEIKPGEHLEYTLANSMRGEVSPDNYSHVTIDLTDSNKETTVVISDDVGSYEGAEKRYKRSVKGWRKILKGLKKTAEK